MYITCLIKEKNSLNYEDVTEKWLVEAKPNNHKVKELNRYIHNGTSYKVDGKNVVLDYNLEEKETAEWLAKTFGGKVFMCPRINYPEGIKTPDFLFRGEGWDLKHILSSGKRVIDNRINGTKKQTSNYIIDITDNKLTYKNIFKQATKIYDSKDRNWVDKIIIKDRDKLLKVYRRKRD